MSSGYFSYDDVAKDLEGISDKLKDVSVHKKKEIERIEGMRGDMEIIKDYWSSGPHPPTSSANMSCASAAMFIHGAHDYIKSLEPGDFTGNTLDAIIGSGDSIASAGLTLYDVAPPDKPVRQDFGVKFYEIKNKPQRKERKSTLRAYLKRIAPHLVDTYDGSWESLKTNFSDPARGAAFLMREVVTQTLCLLAPTELIKIPGFVPDKTAKGGVTRRHRLEYIAATRARDSFNKDLIEQSIKTFLDTYEAFCEAHKQGPLAKDKIENLLVQADDLLFLLLEAVKFGQP
ncbi:hypothetical protein ACFL5X_03420 [Candidatus Omnitrophota bacterium]